MNNTLNLAHELERLNPEQRRAVEAIDGPVLVIAGPGTGKTQLLSLRIVNILQKRDVSPENILCLTYTTAGAEAMTHRLAGFIGRDAYAVHIATFHSFAEHLRSRFPEYFKRGALVRPISDLQTKRLINELLQTLPVTDPLYNKPNPYNKTASNLRNVLTFIENFQRSGLSTEEFRAIIKQNIAFFEHIEQKTGLLDLINTPLTGGIAAKTMLLDDLQKHVALIMKEISASFASLIKPAVNVPGIYLPYAALIKDAFLNTELYDPDTGKTEAYQELRDTFFKKDHTKSYVFKDLERCRKLLSAASIYEAYRQRLDRAGMYDYHDMIQEAIDALRESAEFKHNLQERYRYLLVDEFQDTNGTQMRLLDLLCDHSPSPNILAVGDDDQAIMRFQGASVEYINQFEKRYRDVTRIALVTNYRSTPSLVGIGQAVAGKIENRSPLSLTEKKLTAFKKESAPQTFTARKYPNPGLQYHDIAKSIREKTDAGFIQNASDPDTAIAVIATQNKSLRSLLPYLNAQKIDYKYKITSAVSEAKSLQTLLALMRFSSSYAAGRTADADAFLPQILASEEFGLASSVYFSFALEAKEKRIGWMNAMEGHPNSKLSGLHDWLSEVSKKAISAPARQTIFELSEPVRSYYERLEQLEQTDPLSVIEFNYGLKALLDLVETERESAQGLAHGSAGLAHESAESGGERFLRLADVTALLDQTGCFDIPIDIEIPVGRPNAVTLTTAHSSKGLEFDLVYLIDADQDTWHKAGSKGEAMLCQNMLFSGSGDANDVRRSLFVAVTRARSALEVSFGKSEIVGELLEEMEIVPILPETTAILDQSEHCWKDSYYPKDAETEALLFPHLSTVRMSPSLLNKFVEYEAEESKKTDFVLLRLLKLPELPQISNAFGVVVHSFMEDYVNRVIKAKDTTVERLLEDYRREISFLDFAPLEKEPYVQRFDLIAEKFLPDFKVPLEMTVKTELWLNAKVDGIQLTGKCDLLAFDDETKTIRIYDYKTGTLQSKTPSSDYHRQLQFYKLLINHSPEFDGWTVSGGADIFVVPTKDSGYEKIDDPIFVPVPDADLDHLRRLIQAVWHRIQNGLFDTSGFETSSHMEAVKEASVYKTGDKKGEPKTPAKADIQEAFEQWLIDEHSKNNQ
ncbi:MAG: ATP-dependent helicase [Methanimicrococcus sp.]|nr:ATP-dependent helicase [Methanimicrococcus sp.]